jgi:hypothetical protein
MLPGDKHSSLSLQFLNFGQKSFITLAPSLSLLQRGPTHLLYSLLRVLSPLLDRNGLQIDKVPICLSSQEVTVHSGHKWNSAFLEMCTILLIPTFTLT